MHAIKYRDGRAVCFRIEPRIIEWEVGRESAKAFKGEISALVSFSARGSTIRISVPLTYASGGAIYPGRLMMPPGDSTQ